MLNKVILGGRICNDVELKTTPSGVNVVQFRIAVDRPYTKGSERKTDFLTCVAWRNTAEFLSKFFHKGSRIIVEGMLTSRDYQDKDGNKRNAYEVVVDNVHFVDPKNDEPSNNTEEPYSSEMDLPF